MKNTLKDVLVVSAIVNFLIDLLENDQNHEETSSMPSSSCRITSPSSTLTKDIKKVLKMMVRKCYKSLQGKLRSKSVYDDFDRLSTTMEKQLLKENYSTMTFLKYCCEVCVLASMAVDLGLRPAPRLAEFYILHTIKKFREKVQFGNDNWRYMSFVVGKYLEEGNSLP